MKRARAMIVLFLITASVVFVNTSTASATDISNTTIDNNKTLLLVIGDAISSFEPSLTVTTTFQPSPYNITIEKLRDCAQSNDPFIGNLFYGITWKTERSGSGYKTHFKFSYYITQVQYDELQSFAVDFASKMDGKSEYEKVKETHDYLVENCSYYVNADGPYNCIFNNESNCNGYALAFYLIMQKCDIECKYVTGYGNGGAHAWNAVKIGSFWYNIDVTWDDANDELSYDYFLKGRGDWTGHSKNSATAGYAYENYNELHNWLTTVLYWGACPAAIVIIIFIKRKC